MHLTCQPLSWICTLLLCLVVVFGCRPPEAVRPTNTTHGPATSNQTTPPGTASEVGDTATASSNTSPSEDSPATEEMSASDETQPSSADETTPKTSEVFVRQRPIPKPQPGKTIDMTFDDIKFDIEPDAPFHREMLPQGIEDLNGQTISIGGYMLPSFQQRDIKQFVLVRDNLECCFGPGAALYDCILIELDGRGVDFTVRPVVVEGTFTIKEYKDPSGKHLAIYHMQGTGVR